MVPPWLVGLAGAVPAPAEPVSDALVVPTPAFELDPRSGLLVVALGFCR